MTRLRGSLVMCLRSQRGPAPIVQRPRTPAFHAGNTGSNPVGGTKDGTTPDVPPWSCGAVWSARRPVKPEVAGSNPVRTANLAGSSEQVGRGRVAQLEEHSPEKRGVPGSTPGPTTAEGPPPGGPSVVSPRGRASSSNRLPVGTTTACPPSSGCLRTGRPGKRPTTRMGGDEPAEPDLHRRVLGGLVRR